MISCLKIMVGLPLPLISLMIITSFMPFRHSFLDTLTFSNNCALHILLTWLWSSSFHTTQLFSHLWFSDLHLHIPDSLLCLLTLIRYHGHRAATLLAYWFYSMYLFCKVFKHQLYFLQFFVFGQVKLASSSFLPPRPYWKQVVIIMYSLPCFFF